LDRLKNSSGGSGSGIMHRTSVHGYGETHWAAVEGTQATVDQHRFVIGVHSEISSWIHLNAEIDFEHAANGTKLEFEFGHLDFLVSDTLNFRVGTMLMPMGNLNEFHEPNNFYTVERPDFHKILMPSTWQQAGAGLFGSSGDLSYRLYVTNALITLDDTRKFDNGSFGRGGRSQIREIEVGNVALTGRIEKKAPGGQAGFSFYTGDSTADRIDQDGNVTIVMADYKTRRGPAELDFGLFKGWVSDTAEINTACTADVGATNACDGTTPKSAFGYIGTFAVHLPELMGKKTTHDWIPFVQYSGLRPVDEEGDNATSSDPSKNYDQLAVGVAYKPHEQVAIKAHWRINYYGGTEVANSVPGDAGTSKTYFDFGVAYSY